MSKKKLHRTLGLGDILMFGVGGIVGAGIYAVIGEAAGPSGYMLWLSFGLAAFVAFLTGLTYAEFVSRFPDAGGSFEYVKQGLGRKSALYLSIIMLLTNLISPAAIALSFSDYLGRLIDIPAWTSTLGIIILMALINAVGMRHSSRFNMFATVVTLLGLGVVIGFSIPEWETTDLLAYPETGTAGILAGSALIFFSYIGFEDLVKMAEETKTPEKVLPKGILISSLVVCCIYLLIAISAVSVLTPDELARSKGPLAKVMTVLTGPAWVTGLIIVALFATSKTILSNILGSSRLIYDVARDGHMDWLKKMAHINHTTKTPVFSILVSTAIVIAFALIGNLKVVVSIANIFVFILFLSVNISLINYRLKEDPGKPEAPFHIPLNIKNVPVPAAVAIAGLLILLVFNIANLV